MLIINLGWKNLQGTNTLAYFDWTVSEEVKKFYNIDTRLLEL